ncbi:MAG: alpha/beta hydrolase fold domain-containing protein [candidate division KSB1 bacterium]|nr:alpha/beta hydrolase fold domain-containing protein [candidate division KSB1 bacterium]MDZ7303667.1 alpha/beta hydrolase fold domain-containing protein [candidate division KSB1 bacterium]MDZ7313313.1 alpha/beta hydrolase fold domain-containing protein [candidate division KSB1 bacterium]
MKTRFSFLALAALLLATLNSRALFAQFYEIKHETVNAFGWFGVDNRPNQRRTVGVGQSVLIDTAMTVRNFAFYFRGPFDYAANPEGRGHAVTLTLNVRDATGAILKTLPVAVADTFSAGWVTWSGINLAVAANTTLIFTCYLVGGFDVNQYTASHGADANQGYPEGLRYGKDGTSDADMESWTDWVVHSSWDSAFRLQGTLGPPPTFANLDYVGHRNPKQFLDLYVPAGLTSPAPLAIYIHGGEWRFGSKGGAMSFCDTLLANGYVVADINYRLSGDSLFPAQIFDCKAAVRWLKARARVFNIDTCRVAVIGSSAGGHLAALLGTTAGVDSLEDFGLGSQTTTSRVHAVITFYAPFDFLLMDGHFPQTPPDSCTHPFIHDAPDSPASELLGCQISLCPDRVREASPITYIDASDAPFKLYHGTFDCTIPPYQSVLMDSVLRAANVFSSLTLVPHAVHAFRPNAQQKQDMLAFLNQKLTGCSSTGLNEKSELPLRFGLDQNYPNPFNPSTTITYSVAQAGNVELTIFNTLGQAVRTLVNERKPAGEYSLSWDGRDDAGQLLSSGPYFYRLKVGEAVETRRLLFLK